MATVAPKILALSYYDGAIEGFFDDVGNDQVFYFKVVAWDQSQDKRLYVFGRVDKAIYLELLSMFANSHSPTPNPTWAPPWVFVNDAMKNRANEIVEIGRQSMSSPSFFALGDDLNNVIRITPSVTGDLVEEIARAGEPGNLEDWLVRFNIKQE